MQNGPQMLPLVEATGQRVENQVDGPVVKDFVDGGDANDHQIGHGDVDLFFVQQIIAVDRVAVSENGVQNVDRERNDED